MLEGTDIQGDERLGDEISREGIATRSTDGSEDPIKKCSKNGMADVAIFAMKKPTA
jgi:hypothetical protein